MGRKITTKTAFLLLAGILLCICSACGKNTYSVVFNVNGGEVVSGELEQSVEEGGSAVAPEVENGNRELTWDKDFSNVTGNLIVNAVWASNSYTVTFDPGIEGQSPVEVEVEEGEAAAAPTFSADGKTFAGWDKDFNNVTENMTVTAQWDKKVMTGAEISDYSETRTGTVRAHDGNYDSDGSGSGFFIDDNGTFVTNYHVISFADSLSVEMNDGGVYNVERIIDFSEKYDLAILKVAVSGNDYYEVTTDITRGEQVYAIGSALGELTNTLTSGIISNTSRTLGVIDCIQMDAPISHGNSGGPLVNSYGEVIGINSYSFVSGENLNLAINVKMLDELKGERNFTVNDYVEWWRTEIARSYHAHNSDNLDYYQNSIVNTYQSYTGSRCLLSMNEWADSEAPYDFAEDYDDRYYIYLYDYSKDNYDKYVEYLKDLGYVYDASLSEEYNYGSDSIYYSEASNIYISMYLLNEKSVWGAQCLLIGVYY